MSNYYDQAIQTIQEDNASLTPEAVEAAGNAVLFTDSDWAMARKNIRTSVGQGTYGQYRQTVSECVTYSG
ncbi:hypothetical protein N5V64_19275 [Escherichia coli]|uniref:hypothetical protein n=1 Tax=Escherichia coli TaxID=562 RepID=UPI0021B67D7F|nr:hypothetical protein [Escherichia coli]MCT7382390.1 hypothetical protein [Escherichia coli]